MFSRNVFVPGRIIQVMDRLNVGGAADHVILLARSFSGKPGEAGWSTLLVYGRESEHEGSMVQRVQERSVALHPIPALGREIRFWEDLKSFWQIYRLLRRERPMIVHTHKSKAGALGRLAAWLCGVPVRVHTFHGHVFDGYFSPLKTRVFIAVEKIMALISDRVIAVSPRVKDDLIRYGVSGPDKIQVCLLGLEMERFRGCRRNAGLLRRELGLPQEAVVVGIVARLCPIKDIPTFLRAASRLSRRFQNLHFVIVGDGELRHDLEAMAREEGIASRTHFLGFRDDLERLYADIDILALTSLNEGSPVSLIEGLAAGCAVVATDVGGVRDVVEEGRTGILVPARSPEALAQAVSNMLEDPHLRARLSREGQADVCSRFSIETMIREMEKTYLDLCRRKGLARASR